MGEAKFEAALAIFDKKAPDYGFSLYPHLHTIPYKIATLRRLDPHLSALLFCRDNILQAASSFWSLAPNHPEVAAAILQALPLETPEGLSVFQEIARSTRPSIKTLVQTLVSLDVATQAKFLAMLEPRAARAAFAALTARERSHLAAASDVSTLAGFIASLADVVMLPVSLRQAVARAFVSQRSNTTTAASTSQAESVTATAAASSPPSTARASPSKATVKPPMPGLLAKPGAPLIHSEIKTSPPRTHLLRPAATLKEVEDSDEDPSPLRVRSPQVLAKPRRSSSNPSSNSASASSAPYTRLHSKSNLTSSAHPALVSTPLRSASLSSVIPPIPPLFSAIAPTAPIVSVQQTGMHTADATSADEMDTGDESDAQLASMADFPAQDLAATGEGEDVNLAAAPSAPIEEDDEVLAVLDEEDGDKIWAGWEDVDLDDYCPRATVAAVLAKMRTKQHRHRLVENNAAALSPIVLDWMTSCRGAGKFSRKAVVPQLTHALLLGL